LIYYLKQKYYRVNNNNITTSKNMLKFLSYGIQDFLLLNFKLHP